MRRRCSAGSAVHTFECPNCSVSLTVHARGHHGSAAPTTAAAGARAATIATTSAPIPTTCLQCAAPYLEHVGFGTERVEAEIRGSFPEARVGARRSRHACAKRGSLVDVLERFARREIDVLVGTQMIAKGHDFPT